MSNTVPISTLWYSASLPWAFMPSRVLNVRILVQLNGAWSWGWSLWRWCTGDGWLIAARPPSLTTAAREQHVVQWRQKTESPSHRRCSRRRTLVTSRSTCNSHIGRRRFAGNDVIVAGWRHVDAETAATPWRHSTLTLTTDTDIRRHWALCLR